MSIFLNLNKEFDRYYINELNPFLYYMYLSLRLLSFDEFISIREKYISKFGDFTKNKDSYYKMREFANSLKFENIEKGVLIYFVCRICINGLFRVNWKKMTMNQSFGKYWSHITKNDYNIIHNKLNNAYITNIDYRELNIKNAFYFFDPPYIEKDDAGYNSEFFNKLEFLKFIDNKKFIYTDIYNEEIKYPFFVLQNNMKNAGPNKNINYNVKEVAYYNFSIYNKLDLNNVLV